MVRQFVVRIELVGQLMGMTMLATPDTAAHLTVDVSHAPTRPRPNAPLVDFPAVRAAVLADTDALFLLELLSDPAVCWYEPLAVPPTSPAAIHLVRNYIHKASHPTSTTSGWAVVEAGQRVGVCQLRQKDDGYLVGASLFPHIRGRGLGTAIFKSLAAYAFGNLDASHVAGEVEDDNIPSIRALHKAAYVPSDRYQKTLDNGRPATVTRFDADRASLAAARPVRTLVIRRDLFCTSSALDGTWVAGLWTTGRAMEQGGSVASCRQRPAVLTAPLALEACREPTNGDESGPICQA